MGDQPPPYQESTKTHGAYPPPGGQAAFGYPPQTQYSTGPPQQPTYTQQPGYAGSAPQAYPQQQYYPPPPAQQNTSVVVVQQPTRLGPQEANVHCPHCNATVITQRDYQAGLMTWLICLGVWFIGGALGCCLIPFCIDECKDVIHKCPNCQAVIGVFKRIS